MGAPVAGTVVDLAGVGDPVFAQEVVGPGAAVDPLRAPGSAVVAPLDGVVAALYPHAFVVQADPARSVLVHLGLDTVQLAGAGFTLHVAREDRVTAGDPLITWDPGAVARGGRSPVCPVVALQAGPGAVHRLRDVGVVVRAGEPLLTWD